MPGLRQERRAQGCWRVAGVRVLWLRYRSSGRRQRARLRGRRPFL